MKMTQHTQEKWYQEIRGSGVIIREESTDAIITTVKKDADARLIAAAPQMLETLVDAMAYMTDAAILLENGVDHSSVIAKLRKRAQKVREVIAAATGE
jgi:hypothetical protein